MRLTRLARSIAASMRRSSKAILSWRARRPPHTSPAASAGCERSWPRRNRPPDERRAAYPLKAAERVNLGRTELRVSRLGFGTAPLGGLYKALDVETAAAAVDHAWQAGIRFFDTAPLYGNGLAEKRLGRALATKPRAEVVAGAEGGGVARGGAP